MLLFVKEMHGVVIHDASDLFDVLTALGAFASDSEWICCGVECFGERADDLHLLSDSGGRVSGRDLAAISSGISQTIEGYFRAYRPAEGEPWIIIRAVEGDFDVQSDEPALFAVVRQHFRDVTPFPSDEVG